MVEIGEVVKIVGGASRDIGGRWERNVWGGVKMVNIEG